MLDVLEHLDAPEEALAMRSHFEGSGMIVPPCRRSDCFGRIMTLERASHAFTKGSFRLVAASAGMQIMEMRYFFHWLLVAKLAARMRNRFCRESANSIFCHQWISVSGFSADRILTRRLRVPFGALYWPSEGELPKKNR